VSTIEITSRVMRYLLQEGDKPYEPGPADLYGVLQR
jgi:hypothetical protein